MSPGSSSARKAGLRSARGSRSSEGGSLRLLVVVNLPEEGELTRGLPGFPGELHGGVLDVRVLRVDGGAHRALLVLDEGQ